MNQEELYTVKEIAKLFGLPYEYVSQVSNRPHYKFFFEKRHVEKLKRYPNGRYYPYVYKLKILKPEYRERFFQKMESAAAEKTFGFEPELDRHSIPKVYNWTHSAVECYQMQGNCEFCRNWSLACKKAAKFFFDGVPPMKKAMKKLLEQNGKPPFNLIREIEENIA